MESKIRNGQIEFNWGKSIFPIIGCEFDAQDLPKNPVFLGTGFLAIIEGYPVLISAKHVLGGFENSESKPCIATRFGARPILKLSGAVVEHQKTDITFFLLEPKLYEEHKEELSPIPITYASLHIGMDVFTVGYPNSRVFSNYPVDTKVLEIDQFYFKGYISNIVDTTDIQGVKRTYLLNFPAMQGISGAPLLIATNNGIACVGFIFKQKSSSEKVDEKMVEIAGEKIPIPIYQTYNFGLACDATPLLEIKDLLANVSKKLRK